MNVRRKVGEELARPDPSRNDTGSIREEHTGSHPLVNVVCISYLVLHNKSLQNLVTNNNNHWLLFIVFVGQELRESIASMAFLCSTVSGVSTGRLNGWRLDPSKGPFTHTSGGWLLARTLTCGVSRGLPQNKGSVPRHKQVEVVLTFWT